MFHSPLTLCTLAGKSTNDGVSSTSVYIVGDSNPSAAAGAGRNGVFNVGTPIKDDPHFFRQFDQKEQQPPSMDASCKNTNTNCSRNNAAHESLLTMTSRAGSTQHPTDSVDSHSITTSSLHDVMLFMSEPLSTSLHVGSTASSLPTGTQAETSIAGSDRMMQPREDALLSSSESFAQRTCTLGQMKSAFLYFFYS